MNEDHHHRGDAIWFQIENKTLTVHRCQIKLGESQLSGTTSMLSVLVGKTVKKNANAFDEDARKALERTLQGKKPDVKVKIKTYLVTTCGEAESPRGGPRQWSTTQIISPANFKGAKSAPTTFGTRQLRSGRGRRDKLLRLIFSPLHDRRWNTEQME
jgi:hypothetical protein